MWTEIDPADKSEIDLNERKHFLKANLDRYKINKRIVLRSRYTNRNIKRLLYCQYGWYFSVTKDQRSKR